MTGQSVHLPSGGETVAHVASNGRSFEYCWFETFLDERTKAQRSQDFVPQPRRLRHVNMALGGLSGGSVSSGVRARITFGGLGRWHDWRYIGSRSGIALASSRDFPCLLRTAGLGCYLSCIFSCFLPWHCFCRRRGSGGLCWAGFGRLSS